MLKRGDVCIQRHNNTLWWMGSKRSDDRLIGRCIDRGSASFFEVGGTSLFSYKKLNRGVEVIGYCADYDHALAIATLVGADGFVKGS